MFDALKRLCYRRHTDGLMTMEDIDDVASYACRAASHAMSLYSRNIFSVISPAAGPDFIIEDDVAISVLPIPSYMSPATMIFSPCAPDVTGAPLVALASTATRYGPPHTPRACFEKPGNDVERESASSPECPRASQSAATSSRRLGEEAADRRRWAPPR